jgi:CBS domain-containing protein
MPAPKAKKAKKAVSFSQLVASDIMRRELIALRAQDSLAEAERTLVDAQVGGAPVVDEQGKPIGVVSVRDMARHRTEDAELPEGTDAGVFDDTSDDDEDVEFGRRESGACVEDVMTSTIVSVRPITPLVDVAKRMVEAKVHRVLVVDGDQLLGLLSSMDMLAAMASHAPGE